MSPGAAEENMGGGPAQPGAAFPGKLLGKGELEIPHSQTLVSDLPTPESLITSCFIFLCNWVALSFI